MLVSLPPLMLLFAAFLHVKMGIHMNTIECLQLRNEEGKLNFSGILTGILDFGLKWRKLVRAEDYVANRLLKVLSDDHTLYKDVVLPGINPRQPVMVLLSPQGIRILLAVPLRGIYRAKAEEWLKFDEGSRRFKKTRPNLQETGSQITLVVRQIMETAGLSFIEVETVLVFTNPRTLVDTARPRVRIVPADAIEYFASNIQQLPSIFQEEDLLALSNTLNEILFPSVEEVEEEPEEEVVFDESELVDLSTYGPGRIGNSVSRTAQELPALADEIIPEAPALTKTLYESAPTAFDQDFSDDFESFGDETFGFDDEVIPKKGNILSRIGFNKKQWITLGILGIVELMILGAFAYLIMKYAYLFL